MKGTIWCLHGAVGMAEDWRGLSIPGWAVKRVDLWRFLDCCPMSMPEFAVALNREAEATEGRRVLLGYSMGGRLALHALLAAEAGGSFPAGSGKDDRSRTWESAVIVSAHPGLKEEGLKAERRATDAAWADQALRGDWTKFLSEWAAQGVLAPHSDQAEECMTMGNRQLLVQRRQAVARSFMDWTLGGQEALGPRLGEISCPMLWAVGEKDRKFRDLGERVAAGREASSLMELWVAEGSAHRLPWELGEKFGEKVGEFLERVVS